jgi:hypothetical protein
MSFRRRRAAPIYLHLLLKVDQKSAPQPNGDAGILHRNTGIREGVLRSSNRWSACSRRLAEVIRKGSQDDLASPEFGWDRLEQRHEENLDPCIES